MKAASNYTYSKQQTYFILEHKSSKLITSCVPKQQAFHNTIHLSLKKASKHIHMSIKELSTLNI